MSRLHYPIPFEDWVTLSKALKAKDVLDGSASIIRPFNTEEGINLTTDETNLGYAINAHKLSKDKEGEAEKILESINKVLDPIWEKHVKRVQFAKRFYRSSVHKLIDFGVTVNGDVIAYPDDRAMRCACVKALIDHSNAMTSGTSPFTAAYLTGQEMDFTNELAALPGVLANIILYAAAKVASETATETCDNYMEVIVDHIMAIGQFLMGYFHGAERNVEGWGFNVDKSPKKSVIRDGEVENQSVKTLNKLVTGSDFIGKGPGSFKLFKGKHATGTFVTIVKDQVFKIKYGYGTVTLENIDPVAKVGYEAEFNQ